MHPNLSVIRPLIGRLLSHEIMVWSGRVGLGMQTKFTFLVKCKSK